MIFHITWNCRAIDEAIPTSMILILTNHAYLSFSKKEKVSYVHLG